MAKPLDTKSESSAMLARGVGMLETLDYCRQQTGNPTLGLAVETALLDAALADIEAASTIEDLDTTWREKGNTDGAD